MQILIFPIKNSLFTNKLIVQPFSAVAVGAGGALTGGAKTGDYASITRIGKEFIAKIKEARA